MSEDEMESMDDEGMGGSDMGMGAGEGVTDDDKLWVLLAYALTPIVPIILLLWEEKKDRPFIRAHNAQALAWGLLFSIAGAILSAICIGVFIAPVMWLVGVYWGWQAYQGKMVTIPVITDFVKGQGWA